MKNNLKRYNKKKGFTLVELLVVIAILAVLASVSVIGYLGFTERARNSDALTELAQVRELLRAELIDGEDHEFSYKKNAEDDSKSFKMKYIDGNYYFLDLSTDSSSTTTITPSTETNGLTVVTTQLTKGFSDLNGLAATISVKLVAQSSSVGGSDHTANTCVDYKIEVMTYVRTAGGSAYWTVSGDTITAGTYTVATA